MQTEKQKDSSYIVQLDGIRFFAILMVMVAHWMQWQWKENQFAMGFPFASGVTLFFVLSGFLITDILIKNKVKYENASLSNVPLFKSFYIRRFLRIFPIYYLTIFFLYFISYDNTRQIFPWLVSYSSNIYQSITNNNVGDFNHFWSLAVEEQFYLFWPWVIILLPRRHLEKAIIFIIILSLLTKVYIYMYIGNWMAGSYFTLSCMHALGIGALLAYWSVFRRNIIAGISKFIWVVLSIIVYFGFHYVTLFKNLKWETDILDDFMFAIMAGFIVNYASQDKFKFIFKYILENKFIVYSGKISYGLYVYHLFVPALFWYLSPKIGLFITHKYTAFVAFYFITFLMAHISWKLIESPINSLKKKFPYYRN